MGESRDINEVLAAGFFPTSRAKEATTSPDSPRARRPMLPTLPESPSPELRGRTSDEATWSRASEQVAHHDTHGNHHASVNDARHISSSSRHSFSTPKPSGPRPEPIVSRALPKSRQPVVSPTSPLASSRPASNNLRPVSPPRSPPLGESTNATGASVGREPRSAVQSASTRRYPPPPSVEDLAESLNREYCPLASEAEDEEVIPYRGDVDQFPLLIEVPEHNLERRFVLLTNPAPASTSGSETHGHDSQHGRGGHAHSHQSPSGTRLHSHVHHHHHAHKPKSPLRVTHIHSAHPPHPSPRRPVVSQAHPPTSSLAEKTSDTPSRSRVRSVSSAAQRASEPLSASASGGPPPTDYRPRRVSRSESTSGPEVIKYTSSGKREKVYHGYSRRSSSGTPGTVVASAGRSQTTAGDERRREDVSMSSSAAGSGGRSQSTVELRRMNTSVSLDRTDSCRMQDVPDRSLPDAPRRRRSSMSTRFRLDNAADDPSSPQLPALSIRRPTIDASFAGDAAGGAAAASVSAAGSSSSLTDDEAVGFEDSPLLTADKGKTRVVPPSSPERKHFSIPPSPRHSMPSLSVVEDEEFREQDRGGDRDGDNVPTGITFDPPYPDDDPLPTARPISSAGAPSSRPPISRSRSRGSSARLSMPSLEIPIATGLSITNPVEKRRSTHDTLRTPGSAAVNSPGVATFWPSPEPDSGVPDQGLARAPTQLYPPQTQGQAQAQPQQPPPPQPPPAGTLRRYSEDRDKTPLPDCRRKRGVAGKTDWLTLDGGNSNFNICPACYETVFKPTQFRSSFVPAAPPRSATREVVCDFGAVPWYRIAWLLTLKERRTDLSSFHLISAAIKSAAARSESCPGDRRSSSRSWFGIIHPATGAPVRWFELCYECKSVIGILLPAMQTALVPILEGSSVRMHCAMRFREDRQRFIKYFDLLETASDRAAAAAAAAATTAAGAGAAAATATTTTTTPTSGLGTIPVLSSDDTQWLVEQLKWLTPFVECHRDKPLKDVGWHVLRSVPLFTVCGDCFDDVVFPRVEEGEPVARNFFVQALRQEEPTTCQLYSERMRDVFRKACRRNDMAYLETRVRERCEVEVQIRSRIERLSREADRNKRAAERLDHYLKEWKKWE